MLMLTVVVAFLGSFNLVSYFFLYFNLKDVTLGVFTREEYLRMRSIYA